MGHHQDQQDLLYCNTPSFHIVCASPMHQVSIATTTYHLLERCFHRAASLLNQHEVQTSQL
uniref:Uncharacterized protein n=1 Tax=Arundo donax TaxID=35708 RepID=A0A0A9DXG4_ARUDO